MKNIILLCATLVVTACSTERAFYEHLQYGEVAKDDPRLERDMRICAKRATSKYGENGEITNSNLIKMATEYTLGCLKRKGWTQR